MNLLRACLCIGVTAMLAACGGGGTPSPIAESPDLPLQTPLDARQAPIVDIQGMLHVGADVAAPVEQLPLSSNHGETRVSHGMLQDGVGAAELIAYLQADAESLQVADEGTPDEQLLPGGLLLRFAAMPPTVRVAEGTAPELIDELARVVQSINAALPRDWQLGFSADAVPIDASAPSDGEIVVTFAAQADWPSGVRPPGGEDIGLAEPVYSIVPTEDPDAPFRIDITAGSVWVDPSQTEGQERLGVLAHELIHLLGRNHVDPARFPATLMVAGGSEELSEHILHPLDREALLAVYGRLEPGISPNLIHDELGAWSDTSVHVRGALETAGGGIAFGAALRNGLSQPWAYGPLPHSNLEDNDDLPGSVRWSGRLLGLTPHAETVGGAASLNVELATLSGRADFTDLEHWAANAAPGTVGSGAMWGDGDLSYQIEVRGNTFVQNGGDAGTVTGAFFGPAHEGMGGVLQREDLSAGFGGRQPASD